MMVLQYDVKKKKMYLSEFKMIEKFRTYYMKFGFEMEIPNETIFFTYKNKKQQNAFYKKLINDIKKLKIETLKNDFNKIIKLLTIVIKNNDFKNFKIQHMDDISSIPYSYHFQEAPEEDIPKYLINVLKL